MMFSTLHSDSTIQFPIRQFSNHVDALDILLKQKVYKYPSNATINCSTLTIVDTGGNQSDRREGGLILRILFLPPG